MKTSVVNIGIIGAGNIAHVHAQAIQAIPAARLVGIYSHSPEKAARVAHQYGCKAWHKFDELVSGREINMVCICTPSGAHAQYAVPCLEAGIHCLIEKPIEVSEEKALQIIYAADQNGTKLGSIFHSRFSKANLYLKKCAEEGRFGRFVFGNAYVHWFREQEYYAGSNWRGSWRLDGGGALMNQGIHSVDLLQWIMGDIESVFSFGGRREHMQIEVEDSISSNLKFRNGAYGTIQCSTAIYPGSPKKIEILGTEGSLVIEENEIKLLQFREGRPDDDMIVAEFGKVQNNIGGFSSPTAINIDGHKHQIEDMVEAILYDRPVAVDGREALKSVKIARAIYESYHTGEKVNL